MLQRVAACCRVKQGQLCAALRYVISALQRVALVCCSEL